jgi:hypothetical protein
MNQYDSGEILREYLFSTSDTAIYIDSTIAASIASSTTASASCSATPGFIASSQADALIVTEVVLENIEIIVAFPSDE